MTMQHSHQEQPDLNVALATIWSKIFNELTKKYIKIDQRLQTNNNIKLNI